MHPEIEGLFTRFKELTGDSKAAAMLVLAHATLATRKDSVNPDGEFMSVAQVAAKLSISNKTVWTMIHDGKLRASKIGTRGKGGGTYRISQEDWLLYQAENRVERKVDKEFRGFKQLRL